MTDRPILFSAPMMLQLLNGTKTQTRRVLRNPDYYGCPTGDCPHSFQYECDAAMAGLGSKETGYAIGDRLWVKEAWRTGLAYDDLSPGKMGGEEQLLFEADGAAIRWGSRDSEPGRYRSARFMPRWASRLTLIVRDVRVEQLQKISVDDIWAECDIDSWAGDYLDRVHGKGGGTKFRSIRTAFAALWDSVNGVGAWEANPWVVALTFTVEKRNIDE